MTYTEIALAADKSLADGLGRRLKEVVDLAAILDHEIAQPIKAAVGWEGPIKERTVVFDRFCAALVKAGATPPPLEEELWRAALPKVYNEGKFEEAQNKVWQDYDRVRQHMGEVESHQIDALMTTLLLFPECGEFGGITRPNIMAMVNRVLVDELRLPPMQPNYAAMPDHKPLFSGPHSQVRLLIVDDDPKDIINTALAAVGIPKVETHFFHYQGGHSWDKLKGEALATKLREMADAVLATKADIVLMDEGLGDIEGHQLVDAIKQMGASSQIPLFVANTGGSDDELIKAGCFGNFNKGRGHYKGFIQAMSAFA